MDLPTAPDGCQITQLNIKAETEEAFDAAIEALGLEGEPLTVGPITSSDTTAYSFRWMQRDIGGVHLELKGPERKHKIELLDA